MEFRPCPRNHAKEIRAATGSFLCSPCGKQLERNLGALPMLHQELLHDISSTSQGINPTRVSGSIRVDYLDLSVFDTRHNILTILESWAGIVVERRRTVAPTRSVPHLVRFLILNLEWLAGQPPAADFADEIESLHGELLRAISPEPPTIKCVVNNCPGRINTSPQNIRRAGKASISCSSGHSWDTHEWLALRRLSIDDQGTPHEQTATSQACSHESGRTRHGCI